MGHFKNNIISLNDLVDTLKLQFYSDSEITLEETQHFNKTIDFLVELKKEAMLIKNQDSQKRFIKHKFGETYFNVMASSQTSFNVVLQNGDYSVSLLRIGKHSNPIIKVEFRAEFLLRFGYKLAIEHVKDFVSKLLTSYIVKVSEIHLAKDIQGYEFSTFDLHRIKTLSKTKTIFHNDISSEYYFGNRFSGFSVGKGDEMVRIYNKTLEIAQKKQKAFISVLSWEYNPDFDNTQNVWRIEFQLRRARLKQLLGNDGLLDSLDNVINSIGQIWAYCIDRFQHKALSTSQLVEQIQGFKYMKDGSISILSPEALKSRFRRADLSNTWKSINTFNGNCSPKLQRVKDISKPEVQYVKNSIKSLFSTFIKLNRGGFSSDDLTSIILDADKESLEKHGLTMIDKARLNALDYVAHSQTFYKSHGIIEEGMHQYKKDLINNLHDTFALLEGENSNLYTFQEFQKGVMNVA